METVIINGMRFPSRRPCVECGTVRGKLRRACPYCDQPVCGPCCDPYRHNQPGHCPNTHVKPEHVAEAREATPCEACGGSRIVFEEPESFPTACPVCYEPTPAPRTMGRGKLTEAGRPAQPPKAPQCGACGGTGAYMGRDGTTDGSACKTCGGNA